MRVESNCDGSHPHDPSQPLLIHVSLSLAYGIRLNKERTIGRSS